MAAPFVVCVPAIAYGNALGAAQLNAIANTPGTFVYLPTAGTVLDVGVQTLRATFAPADSVDYMPVSASAIVTVAMLPAPEGSLTR